RPKHVPVDWKSTFDRAEPDGTPDPASLAHFLRRTGTHFGGKCGSVRWSHFLRRTGAHFGRKCSCDGRSFVCVVPANCSNFVTPPGRGVTIRCHGVRTPVGPRMRSASIAGIACLRARAGAFGGLLRARVLLRAFVLDIPPQADRSPSLLGDAPDELVDE